MANSSAEPKSSTVSNVSANVGYVPFSLTSRPTRLPEKNWFENNYRKELREWADSLDMGDVSLVSANLFASLVERSESQNRLSPSVNIGLALLVRKGLSALHFLALSNRTGSAGMLAFVLIEAVRRMNDESEMNLAAMKAVAKSEIRWPVIYSPNKFFSTDVEALQQKLAIGDDYYLKIKKRGKKGQSRAIDFETPLRTVVLCMVAQCDTPTEVRYQTHS